MEFIRVNLPSSVRNIQVSESLSFPGMDLTLLTIFAPTTTVYIMGLPDANICTV